MCKKAIKKWVNNILNYLKILLFLDIDVNVKNLKNKIAKMYFYGQSSEYEEAVVIFTHLVEKRNVYLIVVDFFSYCFI